MFRPGEPWLDQDGQPIQAHGGGILYDQGMYYWFGEHKGGPTQQFSNGLNRVDVVGVACYRSRDLNHWMYAGLALPAVTHEPDHDLHPSSVVERPKVIYNDATHQYVMWMHIDRTDYAYARAGVAVSDQPSGPYTYLGSMRPCERESRDMTLFKDEDGTAYLIFSTDGNKTLAIARLSADYLQPEAMSTCFVDQHREAPAVFKHGCMYTMITSWCTGWEPNTAMYAVAPNMFGPWEIRGNPCIGPEAATTFRSQGTFVLPVAGKTNVFIFMADRWNAQDLADSRYVWLPIELNKDALHIAWRDQWDVSVFDKT